MIKPVNLFWNWIALQFKIKEVEEEGGGGGGGVSKEYVDTQDAELQSQITNNANNISAQSQLINQVINEVSEDINRIDQELLDLDTNKADKSTTLDGYGITDAYNKNEVDTELNKKLNLAGGTMTGSIIQSDETAIKQSTAKKQIVIYGGTSISDGATLALRGKDRSSGGGSFLLNASNGTNTKTLQGYPDGKLNWDNKEIAKMEGADKTGDAALVITNSSGLSGGTDYASNVIRRISVMGKMVFFTCHLKYTAVANVPAWTDIGTVPEGLRPANRTTVLAQVFGANGTEAAGGNINTTGIISIWTNAKQASNNYQVRVTACWRLPD